MAAFGSVRRILFFRFFSFRLKSDEYCKCGEEGKGKTAAIGNPLVRKGSFSTLGTPTPLSTFLEFAYMIR
jgi:hypothetical protein